VSVAGTASPRDDAARAACRAQAAAWARADRVRAVSRAHLCSGACATALHLAARAAARREGPQRKLGPQARVTRSERRNERLGDAAARGWSDFDPASVACRLTAAHWGGPRAGPLGAELSAGHAPTRQAAAGELLVSTRRRGGQRVSSMRVDTATIHSYVVAAPVRLEDCRFLPSASPRVDALQSSAAHAHAAAKAGPPTPAACCPRCFGCGRQACTPLGRHQPRLRPHQIAGQRTSRSPAASRSSPAAARLRDSWRSLLHPPLEQLRCC